jgi:hypothetical protein
VAVAVAAAVDPVAGNSSRRRAASQQLQPVLVKRERSSQRGPVAVAGAGAVAASLGLKGLQKIYSPKAKPQSEGQARALELVHSATP